MKKLYRSDSDRKVCGVCGGLSEYLEIDATIIRLGWTIFAFTGAGIVAYFVAAMVIPDRS